MIITIFTISLVTICHHTKGITSLLTIFPTLCISHSWLIYFATGSLCLLLSLIYLFPSPRHCLRATVCSLNLYILCFCFVTFIYFLFLFLKIPQVSEICRFWNINFTTVLSLAFSVWLISLSMMPSRSIMLLEMVGFHYFLMIFLWLSNIYTYIYIYIYMLHLLYPFFCGWVPRLFPYLGYYK